MPISGIRAPRTDAHDSDEPEITNPPRDGQRGKVRHIRVSVGTVFEWYDSTSTPSWRRSSLSLFFPAGNDTAALLSAFATYAAGFVVRPFGALGSAGWVTSSGANTRSSSPSW